MNDSHYYEKNLLWNQDTKEILSSSGIPHQIEVATPLEFPKEIKAKWTPEHQFATAINSC